MVQTFDGGLDHESDEGHIEWTGLTISVYH